MGPSRISWNFGNLGGMINCLRSYIEHYNLVSEPFCRLGYWISRGHLGLIWQSMAVVLVTWYPDQAPWGDYRQGILVLTW
jgi:hypothetical protein